MNPLPLNEDNNHSIHAILNCVKMVKVSPHAHSYNLRLRKRHYTFHSQREQIVILMSMLPYILILTFTLT